MAQALNTWNKLSGTAFGRWLFTRAVCFKAPYFASISPSFLELDVGRAVVRLKKRRKVENHIGTVHAIAMANLAELAAGTMMEVSIPSSQRWIPRGMTIEYLAKAESDVTATASLPALAYGPAQDVIVSISVRDTDGKEVSRASVPMYVSPRSTGHK
ncbi:MAG: hotdog fold domain-containing protein [Woeseia sp.]